MLLNLYLSSLLILSFSLPLEKPKLESQILGRWLSEDQEVKIEIFKKEKGYYGKIIWFAEGKENGKHPFDRKNPDPKLRKRPIKGITILSNFRFNERQKKWVNGKIYHPQHGKTFKGAMWLENLNTLSIRGYWGFLYRTNHWQRIQD